MKLIVGLGNPGPKYQATRHNIGFAVIDKLCQNFQITLQKQRFNGIYFQNQTVIIAKPLTYMNLSGDFVQKIAHFYKIKIADILIIHDDIDLEIGHLRLKQASSSGGQNGVKDILKKLGTKRIARLKIGVGKDADPTQHVLSKFKPQEREQIPEIIARAAQISAAFITTDFASLMNKFNNKKGQF